MFWLTWMHLLTLLLLVPICILFYQVNRLKAFEPPRLSKKGLALLALSGPITVKHNSPKYLTSDGKETWGANEHDFQCFQYLWYFPHYINKLYTDLDEPFRIQELGDTRIPDSESPRYGRRYEVYFNHFKLGIVQISAGSNFCEDKSIFLEVILDEMPGGQIPYKEIMGLLGTFASLCCSKTKQSFYYDKKTEHEIALSNIDYAIMDFVWDLTVEESGPPYQLEVSFSGYPEHYYAILQNFAEMRRRNSPTKVT